MKVLKTSKIKAAYVSSRILTIKLLHPQANNAINTRAILMEGSVFT